MQFTLHATILNPFDTDEPSARFGEALRGQVEERLNFFEVSHISRVPPRMLEADVCPTQTGVPPSKNVDAMRRVLEELALEDGSDVDEEIVDVSVLKPKEPEKEKKKKRKRESEAMEVDPEVEREASPSKKRKKERGDKEHKKERKEKKKEGMNVDGPVCTQF